MTTEILQKLIAAELVSSHKAKLTPLTGGVSSDIYLVTDGEHQFVVKQALQKLKVDAEWEADLSRNNFEQLYLRYVGSFLPNAVPKISHGDLAAGFFTMEYLGDGFVNWKSALLAGDRCDDTLLKVTEIIACIHQHSFGDSCAQLQFESDDNFHQLRVSPYFEPLLERYPLLASTIKQNCERLVQCKEALVHGDFSPKNILISDERIVLLDCEVAWYGDPAFDLAFLYCHLLLKSDHKDRPDLLKQVQLSEKYYREMTQRNLQSRLCELIPMLLLARVAGKSPVEYLTSAQKINIETKACSLIELPPSSLENLCLRWSEL